MKLANDASKNDQAAQRPVVEAGAQLQPMMAKDALFLSPEACAAASIEPHDQDMFDDIEFP